MHAKYRRRRALRRGSTAVALAAIWAGSGTYSAQAVEAAPSNNGQPIESSSQVAPDIYTQAKKSGHPIEIEADRTPTTEKWANPDGTTTRRSHLRPVRTRIGGGWQPVDATLRIGPDGRITPAAAVFPISFSPGGSGALATMTKDGKTLTLTWPSALPRPTLDATTATYSEVLPGVDLRLIADIDGIAQHLIIKTREAAANPALKEIRYGVDGLDMVTAPEGGLIARDASGAAVFRAPAPSMWDSGQVDEAQTGKTARDALAAPANREPGPPESPVDAVPVAVAVEPDALRLTPDAALLAAPDTVFPVVIDPVFSDGWREDWTVAYKRDNDSGAASTSYWNGQHFDDKLARVGYENDSTARSYGTAESYFELNTDGLAGSTIISANLNLFNQKSWSCTERAVELGLTNPITSATTWNNRPTWIRTLQTKTFAHGWGTGCTPAGEDFNAAEVKNAVQEAANGTWDNITLGVRAPGAAGKDPYTWKKFANNPYLEVTYNRPPSLEESSAWLTPWSPGGSGNVNIRCDSDPTTWPTIGNTDITLTARVSDPDGGNVWVGFSVWEYAGGGVSDPVVEVAQNSLAHVTIPIAALQDGHRYKWVVHGSDNIVDTGWTSHCGFNVDKSAPTKPTVTPTDGKRIDIPEVPARKPRTLRLKATDNVGILSFCYFIDRYLSTGNEDCPTANRVQALPDTSTPQMDDYYADITIVPTRFPESRLYIRAFDKAGNRSLVNVGSDDVAHQLDWATVPADGDAVTVKTQPVDWVTGLDSMDTGDWDDRNGDLDGDGRPDIVGTSTDGRLFLYGGTPWPALISGREIGGTGWAGAKIAHRGDFTGPYTGQFAPPDGYEDYFVGLPQQDGSYRLFLYANNGLGVPDDFTRKEISRPGGGNWPADMKIITPGDATGDGLPDLLITEGSALVLYPGDPNGGLDMAARRVLDTWDWESFDLYAAGDITGDGVPDLISRRSTDDPNADHYGRLNLHPGTIGPNGYDILPGSTYGGSGWNPASRPKLAPVPNTQGSVEVRDGTKVWVPTAGKETPDLYATGAGGPDNSGLLFFYAGQRFEHEAGIRIGQDGWTTDITGIF
ncbi:DNRLRE domain-containing protein [Embleya sp. NPDC005575]|uniref:DNRLRE domain-containing protein n=1 Tax=Embleya sp. NPDC005575 TaxID=3156892 RepID=UPI0033AA2B10